MSILEAVVLGIVEGFTEFLPISSTGHLILSSQVLGIEQNDFVKSFQIAIQLGAILAVVVLYAKTLLKNVEVLKRVCIAFLPTAFVGAFLYKILRDVLLGSSEIVIAALLAGGIFMIGFEMLHKKQGSVSDLSSMPYSKALLIGVFQSFSIVPGLSRAAATIIGGLILGLERKAIVEFSFLLAIPTMLAATIFDLSHTFQGFTNQEFIALGIGFFVSFVTAVLGIRFLLSFIQGHSFIPFGLYRIILAILFFLFVL